MADPVENSLQLPSAEAAEAITGHEVPGGHTEVAHGGGEGGGLPQFRFEYWGGQILWLLIMFAVIYVLVGKIFAPRMRKALDERTGTISDAVSSARNVQAQADAQAAAATAELAEARARAQRIAADAKAKVKAEAAERQAAEEAKLNAMLGESETRIRASRDQAMQSVEAIAADTAGFLVERLSGQQPAPAELQAALAGAKA